MGYIRIIRPLNVIFTGICIGIGILYPQYELNTGYWQLLAAIISGMLIAAGGYTINDYYDLEIDRINKPERVLPSGLIIAKQALIYGIALFLLGIITAYFTGKIICLLLALINSMLLFLYARYYKKEFLTGNLLVAYACSSSFIYGGIAGNNIKHSLIIAFFAFFYTFMREIVKDMEDEPGDREHGAKTLVIKMHKSRIKYILFLPVIAMTLFTGYLYFTDRIGNSPFILLMFFVILPLLVFYRILSNTSKQEVYSRLSKLMKLDMFILLIIFSTGSR